ncbi:MAG: hypothetical protein WC511_07110 [Candidatus Pacearchaeota archaeon]|jgi:hypothetical protein
MFLEVKKGKLEINKLHSRDLVHSIDDMRMETRIEINKFEKELDLKDKINEQIEKKKNQFLRKFFHRIFCKHIYIGTTEYVLDEGFVLKCIKCGKQKYGKNLTDRILSMSEEDRLMMERYLEFNPYRIKGRFYPPYQNQIKLLNTLRKFNHK